ncbi:flagellar biosynthesis anti-sigma factor FlgM [Niveibacterium umoris]|uniref:Negative regulator of flagellin synthesis n=1 Tax=Niveibacterium umoris TaxID=1193620 RepID=A0A840BKS9_9RHOO|nr:flagellar biosynthesis anti-sigma factor FlgM [Niveibacterium umoris]MBB4011127.1 negative regulator of flagellin synthesis FlgM [Niveibacterium umoris]
MKIEGTYKGVGNAGDVKARGPRESAAKPGAEAGSKVEVSPLASQLQQLQGTLTSVPEVDATKVGELKQAISEGRFRVNPEKVADGLLESVRQMLTAQPRQA